MMDDVLPVQQREELAERARRRGGVERMRLGWRGQVAGPEDEDDEDLKPLPDRLVTELTAERTLALRDKLATTAAVAAAAVPDVEGAAPNTVSR